MLKYILKIIKEERERIHSIMIEIIPEWIEKLEDEDLVFIKKFVLASGSLKEIAKEYDVTYPTVRLRLDRLIQKIKVCDEMDNDPYIALVKRFAVDEKIDFDRYLDYMHGQVKELVTNYGKLDLLWFDFSYDDMAGEKWKATDLIKMVRHYQPDVIIDNRLEGAGDNHGSIATEHPLIYSGDFASPEQIIPPKGVCDVNGEPIPWELCATMNNHWGYCNFDHQYKTPEMLVRKLVECVSKGGNMILNVGPDAKGNIPQESVEILREVGNWMSKNKESIYGCGISNFEKPDWGRYTQKDNVIYAHVYETPLGALPLYGISPEQLAEITYLADGSEVKRGEAWNTALYTDVAFVSFGEDPVFTYPLPDERDTVLKIQLRN